MGYYMAGDYYAAGGLFSGIGKLIGGVAGVVSKVVPGPIGGIASVVSKVAKGATGGGGAQQVLAIPSGGIPTFTGGTSVRPTPGLTGVVQRLLPGGASGYEVVGGRRRRMNVANPKALRRAIRREQGFVKLARRALRGTGYQITSRGGARRRTVNIRESGSGSVVVR